MPDISVIEQFLSPPLRVMTRELVPGVFTGAGSIQRVRGPVNVDAFGVMFEFFSVPAGYGRVLGFVDEFDVRMVQLAAVHTMLDGSSIVSQLQDYNVEGLPFIFAQAFPDEIQYYIAPGVQVVFHWLLAF